MEDALRYPDLDGDQWLVEGYGEESPVKNATLLSPVKDVSPVKSVSPSLYELYASYGIDGGVLSGGEESPVLRSSSSVVLARSLSPVKKNAGSSSLSLTGSQMESDAAMSPLTPLSSPAPPKSKRRRTDTANEDENESPCRKKPRKTGWTERVFRGEKVEVDRERFPLLYRRFPVSDFGGVAGATANAPREGWGDLYTPRWVKGRGADKMGLCGVCVEPRERGGEARAVWLGMKFSAYK
ncbi:hypothetical protein EDD18DRAFT_1140772 [Armillaria luteobubalina]|uniref:Transcription regulator Rua1 C-terminal domain-containing protein n=1 Tax=Armillaria luteobubalina TaxID=153913 RepID=A0AA39QI43_9AGAR|nr:hypothetical protein EDD18DRAFT_1140772 [Armillaria luteobubalina]